MQQGPWSGGGTRGGDSNNLLRSPRCAGLPHSAGTGRALSGIRISCIFVDHFVSPRQRTGPSMSPSLQISIRAPGLVSVCRSVHTGRSNLGIFRYSVFFLHRVPFRPPRLSVIDPVPAPIHATMCFPPFPPRMVLSVGPSVFYVLSLSLSTSCGQTSLGKRCLLEQFPAL